MLYRPTYNDSDYASELAIENLLKEHPKAVVWIGGDINLPDIDWSSNSISGNSYRKNINEKLIHAIENSGLNKLLIFQPGKTIFLISLPRTYPLLYNPASQYLE